MEPQQSTPTVNPEPTTISPSRPQNPPPIETSDSLNNGVNNNIPNQDSALLSDTAIWLNGSKWSKTYVTLTLYKTHLRIDHLAADSGNGGGESVDDIPIDQLRFRRQSTAGRPGAIAAIFTIETAAKNYVMTFSKPGLTMSQILFRYFKLFKEASQRFKLWKSTIENLQAGSAS